MARSTTSFNPIIHGYKFVNSFRLELKYNLPLIGEIDLEDIVVGLCGGMCFSTLDRYYSGLPITSRKTTPGSRSALRPHLIKKQIQSMIPPDGIIKVLNWTARDDEYVWCRTAGRELRKLRTRLDKGQPAVLALIRAGRGDDLTKNHQVVAHAYDLNEQSKVLKIEIYDPNHPQQLPHISMNLTSPSTGIYASQSTGEKLRGYFVIDYKPQKN